MMAVWLQVLHHCGLDISNYFSLTLEKRRCGANIQKQTVVIHTQITHNLNHEVCSTKYKLFNSVLNIPSEQKMKPLQQEEKQAVRIIAFLLSKTQMQNK